MADNLSLLFTLKAKNEATPEIKSLERQIASLKDRIKEVKAEGAGDVGFKAERIKALELSLKGLTGQHRELKVAAAAAKAEHQELTSTLTAISPRLGSLSSSLGSASTGLAATAIGAAAAAAAIGGIALAIVGVSKVLFDLAKSTAEYEGKLFDLSKQTNFSVETLSALSLAAKTSGGSIESVAASLGIFQANMVKASEGNKELAKTFRDLHVDTTDQEKALRQAMTALAAMGETEKQSAYAKQLFGRAGREVLGIIKETNGNLDEAIAKYKDMNLLVGDEAAAAADKFNDSLELLSEQFAGLGRTVGNSVIPVLTVFFDDMSKGLSGNQAEWFTWSAAIEALVAGVLGYVQALPVAINEVGLALAGLGTAGLPNIFDLGLSEQRSLIDRAEAQRAAQSAVSNVDRAMRVRPRGAGTGAAGGGGKGAKNTELADAYKEAALAEKEAMLIVADATSANKRQLDEQTIDIQAFTAKAIELANQEHDAEIARINAEQEALDSALAKKLIKQKEYSEKDRELSIQNEQARQKNVENIFKLEQERDKQIAQAEQAHRERQIQIAEDADKRAIDRIEVRVKKQTLSESEGERQIAAVIAEGFARRKKALEDEDAAYGTTLERRAAITDELIRLDGERAQSAEDAAARIIAAQSTEAGRVAGTEIGGGIAGAIGSIGSAVSEQIDIFDLFGKKLSDVFGLGEEGAKVFGGMLTSAFSSLAQAVGESVRAFVLFGNAGGGIKKFTAVLIAEIAKMAAVQAVWELAQGLAMLALNFFWPDPKLAASAAAHFHAAAVYGGIALIATAAGRAVAGGSFAQDSGGGSSGGSSRSSRGSSSSGSGSPAINESNRVNYQPKIEIHLHGDAAHFDHKVVRAVIDDHRLNGPIRLLTDTGQS